MLTWVVFLEALTQNQWVTLVVRLFCMILLRQLIVSAQQVSWLFLESLLGGSLFQGLDGLLNTRWRKILVALTIRVHPPQFVHRVDVVGNPLGGRCFIGQEVVDPFEPGPDRQGTSSQYQYCYLDLVIWYWDECGNPSGRGCKKSIGQIKSLLGLQFHRKRQISPPSYMNIASLLQFFTQVSNNSLK